MARMKGSKTTAQARVTKKTSRSQDVPDIYQEMLADASASSPVQENQEGRAIKRRRIAGRIVLQAPDDSTPYQSDHSTKTARESEFDELFEDVKPMPQQVVQSDSEDSEDSDLDWEEVNLKDNANHESTTELQNARSEKFNLVLHEDKGSNGGDLARRSVKRKPITIEERKLRISIHKLHVCCLLVHGFLRNHWCNDAKVHSILRKILTNRTISYLNPDTAKSQFQRSRSFMEGLEQACDAFRARFKISSRGLSKPKWANSPETLALMQPPDDIDLPMHLSDFRDAAHKLKASRDIGAQLFCSVLRSAGVDARLVTSLLPLPFRPAPKTDLTQTKFSSKSRSNRRPFIPDYESEDAASSDASFIAGGNTEQGASPKASSSASPFTTKGKSRRSISESKYPVYWVEAFNEASQKWVPIDPIVTRSIAKPSKFEPPAGETENHMSYVIAFEDDGSARDVTRRYVKAYNAKTRRERLETSKDGERWWRKVMKMYKRSHALDRDQVEDAELTAKEAAEPMPRNVQDFKDHPYYALERHLRRHEVIHPRREVGKVSAGKAGNNNALEPIYRRRDVHAVESADKWYRLGREIKPTEQPLKRVPARRRREEAMDSDEGDDAGGDSPGVALYAAHQTTLFTAPAVTNGRIPKNAYGNIDLYMPTMVPPGGAHVAHPETSRAARILGVDYADAVTGFTFKGRHGTAVTKGAVVANEYKDAVEAVIQAFEDERVRDEEARRGLEAMRMWKRMLAGLRIRQRIEGYEIEGEREAAMLTEMEKVGRATSENDKGGFLPDRQGEVYAQPTAGTLPFPASPVHEEGRGGGFLAEDPSEAVGQTSSLESAARVAIDPFIDSFEDDGGGGFLVNDEDADAEDALREMDAKSEEDRSDLYDIPRLHSSSQADRSFQRREFPMNIDRLGSPPKPAHSSMKPSGVAMRELQDDILGHASTADHPLQDFRDDELEEARVLQEFYEVRDLSQDQIFDNIHSKSEKYGEPTIQDVTQDLRGTVDPSVAAPAAASTSAPSVAVKAKQTPEVDNSDDEKGSLLSQDPEDEEADPEWLT